MMPTHRPIEDSVPIRPFEPTGRGRPLLVVLAALVVSIGLGEGRAVASGTSAVGLAAPSPSCEASHPNAVAKADELMADRYHLGTHDPVDIPYPPTWAEDPHSDRNWRYRLHNFDWMLALIEATATTGEVRYLERALDLARSWLDSNPREAPPSDFSWNDHSTALRAQVLVCLATAAPGHEWLLDGLRLHGSTLADPDFYVRRGNHALNQNIGLLEIGCYLGRDAWMELADSRIGRLLLQSVDRQGVVNEQAIGYQLYNYERYLVAARVLRSCGRSAPDGFGRVRRIPRLLGHATQPDGRYPLIGDTLDVAATEITGTIAAFAASGGRRGPKPSEEIVIFDRGYVFGRTGWGETRRFKDEAFFTLRFGEGREPHGHDDQGSLTLYGYGSRLLLDAGLYAYEFDHWRDHFLSRAAHNAVVVAGRDSRWARPTRLRRTSGDARTFEASLEIHAYRTITHHRRVVFSRKLGYVLVEDRLDAPRRRKEAYVQVWHLRDGSRPKVSGSSIRTRRERGNIVIRQLLAVGSTKIVLGRERPLQGWLSNRYRRVKPAPVVEARIKGNKARFLTLLVPVPRADTPVRVSDVEVTSGGVRLIVRIGRAREQIVMTRDDVRISSPR
jgi:Heparinase II/III-like protein/Heparinase II/III N-terminus